MTYQQFSTQHRTEIASQSPSTFERRDFGLIDRFGRRVGATVALNVAVYAPIQVPVMHASYASVAPGTYFTLSPSATRDGDGYGAGQRTQLFATEAERAAAVAKYFKSAEARARRNPEFKPVQS